MYIFLKFLNYFHLQYLVFSSLMKILRKNQLPIGKAAHKRRLGTRKTMILKQCLRDQSVRLFLQFSRKLAIMLSLSLVSLIMP